MKERVERFWIKANDVHLKTSHIAFYFALLTMFAKNDFATRCEISNDELCKLLNVRLHALISIRNYLIDCGLIGFENGRGRKQPTYIIDENFIEKPKEKAKVAKPQQKKKEAVKRKKTTKAQVLEPVLFEEPKKKKERAKKVEDIQPTFEEVLSICAEKGMSEEEAKEFYFYYDAQGWVTSSGQKIKRIDSMVNRWLSNEKRKEKNNANYKDNFTRAKERNDAITAEILAKYT